MSHCPKISIFLYKHIYKHTLSVWRHEQSGGDQAVEAWAAITATENMYCIPAILPRLQSEQTQQPWKELRGTEKLSDKHTHILNSADNWANRIGPVKAWDLPGWQNTKLQGVTTVANFTGSRSSVFHSAPFSGPTVQRTTQAMNNRSEWSIPFL